MLYLPQKKLVIELRYKPDLTFYGKMDVVGKEMAEDFPDWERSPLTIEIRNKQRHRRLFLAHTRCFFDADLVDQPADHDFAVARLRKVCEGLSIKNCTRIGVRQWFAADLGKTLAVMVDEFSRIFLSQDERLSAILTDKTHDVAFVVDYETSDGWKYKLRLGPMLKKQWFQSISHELGIYESSPEDKMTFEKFRESFPEQFLYLDIDCYVQDHPVEKLGQFVTDARIKSNDQVEKLIGLCKG